MHVVCYIIIWSLLQQNVALIMHLTSRARIVGSSDVQSSRQLIKILNDWRSTDGTFVYTGGRWRQRVWVDTTCPLQIESLSAPVCN